jgi:hypothetical protein
MGEELFAGNAALALLANSIATGAILFVLMLCVDLHRPSGVRRDHRGLDCPPDIRTSTFAGIRKKAR